MHIFYIVSKRKRFGSGSAATEQTLHACGFIRGVILLSSWAMRGGRGVLPPANHWEVLKLSTTSKQRSRRNAPKQSPTLIFSLLLPEKLQSRFYFLYLFFKLYTRICRGSGLLKRTCPDLLLLGNCLAVEFSDSRQIWNFIFWLESNSGFGWS